jgi:hypothetical protein
MAVRAAFTGIFKSAGLATLTPFNLHHSQLRAAPARTSSSYIRLEITSYAFLGCIYGTPIPNKLRKA